MDFLVVYSKPQYNFLKLHHAVRIFGKVVIRVACHFSDTIYLSYCSLFSGVGYIKEFLPHYLICDALFFHLRHIDA